VLEALDAILQGVDGAHRARSHRATAVGADSPAEQSTVTGGDALQPPAGREQLRDFDFTFQPSLRREQIESLHELGFIERRENAVFLGPPPGSKRGESRR
jgi:DNA replication protein DnaC